MSGEFHRMIGDSTSFPMACSFASRPGMSVQIFQHPQEVTMSADLSASSGNRIVEDCRAPFARQRGCRITRDIGAAAGELPSSAIAPPADIQYGRRPRRKLSGELGSPVPLRQQGLLPRPASKSVCSIGRDAALRLGRLGPRLGRPLPPRHGIVTGGRPGGISVPARLGGSGLGIWREPLPAVNQPLLTSAMTSARPPGAVGKSAPMIPRGVVP